ncbi:PREDICTED: T-cell surface protein tactile [Pseudopodoces humilis]|uniref:T-cell surface protein tactile n=1 Tax=Pseudopodoces humilis TaxID=181119 RepID=UPI0006B84AA6|nr:PREDICTED: T-cell surface protein tactile [Pseudopodoces humilis]
MLTRTSSSKEMKERWLFSLFCLLSVPCVTGQPADVITQREVVRALPGADVTLLCVFPKPPTTHIIQTQWSKTDGSPSTKIAVFHPTYGTHYFTFSEAPYNFSVSFSTRRCCGGDDTGSLCSTNPNATSECNWWALHLENVTVSLSGQYECTFATYPYGTKAAKIQLTVKAEAYPEIFISLQEGSASTSQKPNVSCVVRKAFHKPSLLWYMDRASLMEKPGEISVVQEDLQDSEGFYELRSTLMLQGTHETYKTFSCVCLFPFLGNETRNISSEEIFVSFGNKSDEASAEVFTTTVSDGFDNSTLTSAVMAASAHQLTSVASLDFTSQANLAPASTTQGALTSTTEAKGHTSATAFSETLTTARSLSYNITDQTNSFTRGKHFFPTSSLLNSTGDGRNTKASHFPWPTVVAVLLLFCSSLVALGIRKWCQYQKEIMNRPPSFKPPPPPIKYTSMVESDGTAPSCHELENL